jgi:hypothetical protein
LFAVHPIFSHNLMHTCCSILSDIIKLAHDKNTPTLKCSHKWLNQCNESAITGQGMFIAAMFLCSVIYLRYQFTIDTFYQTIIWTQILGQFWWEEMSYWICLKLKFTRNNQEKTAMGHKTLTRCTFPIFFALWKKDHISIFISSYQLLVLAMVCNLPSHL